MVDCSRWDEIRCCVEYHVRMASLLHAPTRFRLLNHPNFGNNSSNFSIAENPGSVANEVTDALNFLRRVRPGGCTPLTQHILDIHREVSDMTTELRQTGRRVALIIATDGLPTDERGYGGIAYQKEFVEALRLLEGLPVWGVIRLCADDGDCVDFYNKLDNYLELSIDVWMTFSLKLQRCTMRTHGLPTLFNCTAFENLVITTERLT